MAANLLEPQIHRSLNLEPSEATWLLSLEGNLANPNLVFAALCGPSFAYSLVGTK